MKTTFTSFHNFVFRTPLFPINFLSKDKTSAPEFREAIYLASPELYKGCASKDPKKQNKFKQSILKYYHRATTRCTPFGLFAGCSTGEVANDTAIELSDTTKSKRRTRLDMQYLCALIQKIEHDPIVREQLIYYPNDSLYKIGGKYRYIEYSYDKKLHRQHKVSSLAVDDALETVLDVAAEGATIDRLTQSLVDDEITSEQAHEYILEVIESQVLKSELDPGVVGDDVLEVLIRKLSRLQNVSILPSLRQIQGLLDRIDSQPIGSTMPLYSELLSIIKKLGVAYELKFLFQTDMFKPAEYARIDRQVVFQIAQLIDVLAKINPPYEHPNIQNFIKTFQSRYEEQEVQLSVVLDGELGLGYPVPFNNGDVSPLINDLAFPVRYSNNTTTSQTPIDQILFKKYLESIQRGENIVFLEDKDFERINFSHQFPDTIAVMCNILGNGQINIKSIGGACAANLLGRFCHTDHSIASLVKDIADFEQQQNPDALFAEISHLPESRIGNIASRPVFRGYILHYLSNYEHDGSDIPLSDLMVSIRKGRLFLRSKKYDKEVIPRLTCAHNYSTSPIPVYRFLCDLQHQQRMGGLSVKWSRILSGNEHLPRIQYKNFILFQEQWKIQPSEIKDFNKLSDPDLDSQFHEFLQKRGIPTDVVIPDNDNELYLNLNDTHCQRFLLDEIAKRKGITLEEFLFKGDDGVVRCEDNAYTNEMIFVFHKNK